MSQVDKAAAGRAGIGLDDEAAAKLPKWAQEYVRALEGYRDQLAAEAEQRGKIPRTEAEIRQQIRDAAGSMADGRWTGRWPGTTFEQGVHGALMWVTGQSDDRPMT
jgi:hypothetical protein